MRSRRRPSAPARRALIVTGAGSGATNNVIRSLRAADLSLTIVGCHHDRFVLKQSTADRNYLIPPLGARGAAAALRRLAHAEQAALLVPTTDADVRWASRHRTGLGCRLYLPRESVIRLCQDKYRLTTFLRRRGIPTAATYPVSRRLDVGGTMRRLARMATPVWCRIRTGSGSAGATAVRTAAQARHWIRYWGAMRGVPATAFTLSEYLPGRDFACQGVWQDGRLILIKTCERLAYFVGGGQPSGVSSVSSLARTLVEPRVVDICVRAARALDARLSGVLNFDLKENRDGIPCLTEINAGRVVSGTNIFDLTGKHNTTAVYVRLGLGEHVELRDEYDAAEDWYSVRDLDTEPGIFRADELFDGIFDFRTPERRRSRAV